MMDGRDGTLAGPNDVEPRRFRVRGFVVDLVAGRLLDPTGREVPLRPQAFAVLRHLLCNADRLIGREELMANVWGGIVVTDDSLVQAVCDVRRALGDERHELIHTVRGRGYRLPRGLVSVERDDTDAATSAGTSATTSAASSATTSATTSATASTVDAILPRSRHALWRVAAAALCVAAVVGCLLPSGSRWSVERAAPPPAAAPVVAVMRFGELWSGDDDGAFAEGFSEELIAELARVGDIRVIAAHSSFALDGDASDAELARRLGVRYLVHGRVGLAEGRLHVSLQVSDATSARVVLSTDARSRATGLDVARQRLVSEIAGAVQAGLRSGERRRVMRRGGVELDAYALALRVLAREHRFDAAEYRRARAEAHRAIRLDPLYAPAWVNLACLDFVDAVAAISGERSTADLPEIERTLRHGMTLDAENPRAWHLLSTLRGAQERPEEAYEAAVHALQLAPNDPEGLMWLARAEVSMGRVREASGTMARARRAFPIPSSHFLGFDARVRWAAGDHDGAVTAADACLLQTPGLSLCQVEKIVALADAGRHDEARAVADAIRQEGTNRLDEELFARDFRTRPRLLARRLASAELVSGEAALASDGE